MTVILLMLQVRNFIQSDNHESAFSSLLSVCCGYFDELLLGFAPVGLADKVVGCVSAYWERAGDYLG